MTSCSDEECDHIHEPEPPISIESLWYVEADNEEICYSGQGTYYDRYSNVELSGETEGRYEINGNKLTYRYTYLGQNVQDNWTMKDFEEFGFELSSGIATGLNVEKIVEQHKLTVGESVKIHFDADREDITVSSYSSTNELVASVAADGTVSANGGKGTAYIKMQSNAGNVWAKITVGEDNKDLWCNYVSIIGAGYNAMIKFFERLGEEPQTDEDGLFYTYLMAKHQYINNVNLAFDEKDAVISAIQLSLKDGVPALEVKSYLNSRYYNVGSFYSTQQDLASSKALLTFDETLNIVTIYDPLHLSASLWTDFTSLFGEDKQYLNTAMEKMGYPFLFSDYSYSADGSDYYQITDSEYANMVGFVFNPDQVVSEFWVYITGKAQDIYDYLNEKYVYSEKNGYKYIFFNKKKTIQITLDLDSYAVIYKKLTLKQYVPNILGNYHEGLGLTHDQIIEKFGEPYLDNGGMMYYIVGSEYVNLAAFRMNAETNKCNSSLLTINENVATLTIVDFLNSKYTVFANGTAADGSQYAWTDGPSVAESTMGISYYPLDKTITYQSLGAAAKTRVRSTVSDNFETEASIVELIKVQSSTILDGIKKTKDNLKSNKKFYFNVDNL